MNLRLFGKVVFLFLMLPMPAFAREWPSTTAVVPFWFFLIIWLFAGIQVRKYYPDLVFSEFSWMGLLKLIIITEGLVILDSKFTTIPKLPAFWIIFLISVCGYFLFLAEIGRPGRGINLAFHGTFLFLALFSGLDSKLKAYDQSIWTGSEWRAVDKWSFLPDILATHWDWDVFLWYLGIFFCICLFTFRSLRKKNSLLAGSPGL